MAGTVSRKAIQRGVVTYWYSLRSEDTTACLCLQHWSMIRPAIVAPHACLGLMPGRQDATSAFRLHMWMANWHLFPQSEG